jgi:nucleoside-diphosphate-sugar epimerase
MQHTIIAGCGYIGQRLAQSLNEKQNTVFGLAKSNETLTNIKSLGTQPVKIDLDSEYTLNQSVFHHYCLYYFAPPPATGETDNRINAFLNKLPSTPEKIVLISTTGVYGDNQGNWVSEESQTNPTVPRAMRRCNAEKVLTSWCQSNNVDYIILRVSGIYSSDRLPIERIQQKKPVICEQESPFSNRIHAEDLVNICRIAMQSNIKNEIFNCSDGNPTTMFDYFNQVAEKHNLPKPPVINLQEGQAQLSAGMMSYMNESRKVNSNKLRDVLGYEIKFKTLKEGLNT